MKKVHFDKHHEDFKVLARTPRSEAAIMVIPPGDAEGGPDNAHHGSDQWLFVISGHGRATVEQRHEDLAPHDLLLIEADEKHEIRNDGDEPLVTLNFYAPKAY
jgi:mannose-6-phosphate isomerase-like protein (cupin superfamily)